MAGKQLDACISEVVRKFQATANVRFQLKERQLTAVKILLLNHEVLAVLPTGYGKSLIFQSFVVAKKLLSSAKACVLVICPLTSISINFTVVYCESVNLIGYIIVCYLLLYNNPSYSRILIGSCL